MGNQLIKKISLETKKVFPKAYISDIEDKNSGIKLSDILNSFNMYFVSYAGSSKATRATVPMDLRRKGLWITYVNLEDKVITEWYASDNIDLLNWTDDSNWRIGTNSLVGDLTISANGKWVVNGVETEFDVTAPSEGYTFTPHVSEDGVLSWTNDGDLKNPDPVNLKGAAGTSPNLTVGEINTVATGDLAKVSITGKFPDLKLNMDIPRGAKGTTGSKGDKGDKGDAFQYSDFTPELLLLLRGEKGEQGILGILGIQGESGPAPNISIGTITSVESDLEASASIYGTSPNLILNLSIPKGLLGKAFEYKDFTSQLLESLRGPKGDLGPLGIPGPKGEKGDTGPQGTQGIQGPKGNDGTGVTILGSYNSLLELLAAHPVGNIGDSYIVSGDLYVWSENTSSWLNVGTIKGPLGPLGPKGNKGDNGIGIQSVTEFNGISSSNISPPETYVSSDQYVPSVTEEKPYLWTYTQILYTDSTILNTAPRISKLYVKDGNNGLDGTDGISILSIELTTTSSVSGGTNIITCTLNDGTTTRFNIKNGILGLLGDLGKSSPILSLSTSALLYQATNSGYASATSTFSVPVSLYVDGKSCTILDEDIVVSVISGVSYAINNRNTITFTINLNLNPSGNVSILAKGSLDGVDYTAYNTLVVAPIKQGALGIKGNTGDSGRGINSIVYWNGISHSDTVPPETFVSSEDYIPKPTLEKPYLWTYVLILYTDGVLVNTSSLVSKIYVENGVDGVSVQSIELTTTSYTSGGNNIITCKLSNGTTTEFTIMNGLKGDRGFLGNPGTDGKGVTSMTIFNGISSSETIPPDDYISSLNYIPVPNETKPYLWSYIQIIYSDGDIINTTPSKIKLYAKDGEKGVLGEKGENAPIVILSLPAILYQATNAGKASSTLVFNLTVYLRVNNLNCTIASNNDIAVTTISGVTYAKNNRDTVTCTINSGLAPSGVMYILITGSLDGKTYTSSIGVPVLPIKQGTTGITGATGVSPNISIGTVTTGAAGSSASATITGTTPNLTLNLSIPRGNTGATGAKGDKGDSGENLIWIDTSALSKTIYYDKFHNTINGITGSLQTLLGRVYLMQGNTIINNDVYWIIYVLGSQSKFSIDLDGYIYVDVQSLVNNYNNITVEAEYGDSSYELEILFQIIETKYSYQIFTNYDTVLYDTIARLASVSSIDLVTYCNEEAISWPSSKYKIEAIDKDTLKSIPITYTEGFPVLNIQSSINSKSSGIEISLLSAANVLLAKKTISIVYTTDSSNFILYVTFALLKDRIANSGLIPGLTYTITNYKCSVKYRIGDKVYEKYNGGDGLTNNSVNANNGWYINVRAVTRNTFDENAFITFASNNYYTGNKILECKYTIDKTRYEWTSLVSDSNYYGTIYYLKDEYYNECEYDFKHVTFPRWKILNIKENDTPSNADLLGPFRCYGESTGTRTDSRLWTGSGHSDEKILIPKIFNGTFTEITNSYQELSSYRYTPHSDYLTYLHKGFNWFPYLSWREWSVDIMDDMSLGDYMSLAKVVVDDNSTPLDIYTFSVCTKDGHIYEGSSEKCPAAYGSTELVPIFSRNVVKRPNLIRTDSDTSEGYTGYTGQRLPNIVILVSSDYSGITRYVLNNEINGYNSTILLHPYGTLSNRSIAFSQCKFGINNQYGLLYSIICTPLMLCLASPTILRSYLAASIQNSTMKLLYCTLFGHFSTCRFDTMTSNLLFGTFQIVKKSGATSWTTASDGRYWYDVICDTFNSANIFNAFLYGEMGHHINSCTVVDAYNKGARIYANLLCIYVKGINYNTTIGYAGISGQACYDHITYCDIPTNSLVDLDISGDGKSWYKVNEDLSYPSFKCLDFKGCRANHEGFMLMYNGSNETDFKGTVNWNELNRYIVTTTGTKGGCKLIAYRNLG